MLGLPPDVFPSSTPPSTGDFYDRLQENIAELQADLKGDEHLEILCNPAGEPLSVENIGFHGPDLVILYGRDAHNNETTALVHVNTVQLVLKVMKAEDPAKRRRISFIQSRNATPKADDPSA